MRLRRFRIPSFIHSSHRPPRARRERGALRQFIADNNAAGSRTRARQNFLSRWAYIYQDGHTAGSRCLAPCRLGDRQVFRLISRCNFSPFSPRGPPARSRAPEGWSCSPPGRVGEGEAPASEGRLDFSRQTRVKLVSVY